MLLQAIISSKQIKPAEPTGTCELPSELLLPAAPGGPSLESLAPDEKLLVAQVGPSMAYRIS